MIGRMIGALVLAAWSFSAWAESTLPPLEDRIPATPMVVDMGAEGLLPGKPGGTLRLLMARSKDTRMMSVYGYARLIGYDRSFTLKPDLLERVDVEEGRRFTLHLRKGHRWSDGQPFTSEDFRYYWEDIAQNDKLSPAGPSNMLLIDGEQPVFEVLSETAVRYSWSKPNPYFLPELAKARPLYIYAPAHYLKAFHPNYTDQKTLDGRVKENKQRNWVALHTRKGHLYKQNNVDLPTLQPWVLKTPPPADRFIFTRNPYYHRVDETGRQLPYIDRVAVTIANSKLIPAKAGSGEADLQARSLSFNNYTFLKQGEKRNPFKVRLWRTARGSQVALFPNLNAKDPVWRGLLRNVNFRRALSLAVNRHEINQVIFFGLALEAGNTVLPQSTLYDAAFAHAWTGFDLKKANELLDGMGLTQWTSAGYRKLPDGREMQIVVETAGESTEETDILELIRDSWREIGVKLFTKPLQREVFRNRVFTGSTVMSVWFGLENGVASAQSSPHELAPTAQTHLQWPKWGQYVQTNGKAGEPIDVREALYLADRNRAWRFATSEAEKEKIWKEMLEIFADQVFTIGLICGVRQPVVVHDALRNVPEEGLYNWEPGAHFGVHRPDTFWFDDAKRRER